MKAHILKVAKLASWPAEAISATVGKVIPHDRTKGKVAAGVCLMIGASGMATSYPVGCVIPHCIYDALAYFLHACGCTPVIEAYCDRKRQRREAKSKKQIKNHHATSNTCGPAQ